jgi:hypothetical protein
MKIFRGDFSLQRKIISEYLHVAALQQRKIIPEYLHVDAP